MKKILVLLSLGLFVCTSAQAGYVKGYTRKDGTYVAPYYRGGSSGSSGSTYTAPVYVAPVPVPTVAMPVPVVAAPVRITTLPPTFNGKPCGKSFIAQNKTCLVDSPQHKTYGFENCTEAWANGAQDIPRGDPAYADKLDRDHDGIACEVSDMYDGTTWMYDMEDKAPAPLVAPAGRPYVKIDDLHGIGAVVQYGNGNVTLITSKASLTFTPGQNRVSDGTTLEAPPFSDNSHNLYIPLVAIATPIGCTVTNAVATFTAVCPDKRTAGGQIYYR